MTPEVLLPLCIGALMGGFVSGYTGFGTALVVSGLWFASLPTATVPPLIILIAFSAQVIGLLRLRKQISFESVRWVVFCGMIGVPTGTALVVLMSATWVKLLVGGFLVLYVLFQLTVGKQMPKIKAAGQVSGAVVGFLGGVFGGIAGLAGPLPIIWYQLQGLSPAAQRARYQAYNFAILGFSALCMSLSGAVTFEVLRLFSIALPTTIGGTFLGLSLYSRSSEQGFKQVVLLLLFVSGAVILAQVLTSSV